MLVLIGYTINHKLNNKPPIIVFFFSELQIISTLLMYSWQGSKYPYHLILGCLPLPAWHYRCLNVEDGAALGKKGWRRRATGNFKMYLTDNDLIILHPWYWIVNHWINHYDFLMVIDLNIFLWDKTWTKKGQTLKLHENETFQAVESPLP